jgi:hypothetical protein
LADPLPIQLNQDKLPCAISLPKFPLILIHQHS